MFTFIAATSQTISTHTLTWSVTLVSTYYTQSSIISTHTLTWSVTSTNSQYTTYTDKISTHTLTWSVTCNLSFKIATLYNFNSHAHVERDIIETIVLLFQLQISTHTLTWSVTLAEIKAKVINIISTHTLTWSVTATCLKH